MPFNDTIAAIPQADTDRIARRLLGDDMVDRYGDVLGTRKHGLRDIARDFALGVAGGPTKSLELRAQVREQFQKAYDKEAKAAAVKAQQDREQATMVINTLKGVAGLAPGHRAAIFQETLDQAGIPYSKAAVKFLTDADTLAQLPMDDLMEKAEKGEVSIASISSIMGSGSNAARWYTDMVRAKKDRQQTGNMILDAEMKRVNLEDIQRKIRERMARQPELDAARRERLKGQKLDNANKRKALTKPAAGKGMTGIPELDAAIAAPAQTPPAPPATPPAGAGVGTTPNIKAITQVQ